MLQRSAGATRPIPTDPLNADIAQRLAHYADLLSQSGANPHRVGAWRKAGETIATLDEGIAERFDRGGEAAIDALPGVGDRITAAIVEMIRTGRWSRLERQRNEVPPGALLRAVPGIGPELAARIHGSLGIDRLEDLEAAAHDGRLGALPGIGPRRLQGIRTSLASILGRVRGSQGIGSVSAEPDVSVLLDVDREYRERAARDELPTIAPRRFNPERKRWLPRLTTQRGRWQCTALYSNTARAHLVGKTDDWVVIIFDDGRRERMRTVVTETQGPLQGKRVVRGREAECLGGVAAND